MQLDIFIFIYTYTIHVNVSYTENVPSFNNYLSV